MSTVSREFEIVNEKGLHARAATALVKTAAQFTSSITIHRDGTSANGKSVMSLLILAAPIGSRVTVEITGEDAEPAMTAVGELIQSGFGE